METTDQRQRNAGKRGVFPDGVTRQDILEAIAKFDAGTRHDFAESTHYDLLLPDGRRYPPKAIAGIAATRVAGRILKPEHFSAGDGQKCFRVLGENGFQIVPKLKGNEVKPLRNPPWKREELLLALELYLRNRKSPPSKTSREVESLSKELNQLRARIGRRGSASFRNAAGVYLKMMNFRSYDPDYTSQGKVGMRHGNKLDAVIWTEFFGKHEELFKACRAIREALKELPEISDDDSAGDGFAEAHEGKLLTKLHRRRERSVKLVNAKKKWAMKKLGALSCEVCGFNFSKRYGERGQGFIECHHTKPIHDYGDGQKTTTAELALVCANCHRVIHAKRPWLTIKELQALLC
jgi:5-methylcytosine-specific restriction protein A